MAASTDGTAHHNVQSHCQADEQSPNLRGPGVDSRTKDHKYQEEGEYDLRHEAHACRDALAQTGCSHPNCCKSRSRHRHLYDHSGDDSTQALRDDVANGIVELDFAPTKAPKVTAGLRCPPLVAAVALTMTAIVRPWARAIPANPKAPPEM